MAIRIDASGDYVRRTTSLPSDTLFTIMGWCNIVNDRTNNWRFICSIEDNVTTATGYKALGVNITTGGDDFLIVANSGAGIAEIGGGISPTNGEWFYFALVGNGTGAASLVGYHITAAGVVSAGTDNNNTAFTEAVLYLGNDSYDEWNNQRLANILVYDAALTQAEIVQQMWQYQPVRLANIHAWWPMLSGFGERLKDYSGNGRDLTASGTLSDEAEPPIRWGLPLEVIVPNVAAAPAAGSQLIGGKLVSNSMLLAGGKLIGI